MLDRFKVPSEDAIRVPEDSLRRTVTAIFEKMGVTPEDAIEGADVLVTSDLRGVETHGVSNMLRKYLKEFNNGKLNPKPNWHIVRESPGTATINADRGLGIILGPKAMRIAIDKAKKVGVGIVTMFKAGHSGAVGHHAMVAAHEDMIGMCATSAELTMVPTFGAEPIMGTNPIAIAAPTRNESPILFDAATTNIASNKIRLANRVGATLLPGWIAETDGSPILEETAARESGQYYHLPVGGTRERGSHKGYGFGLIVEILTTLLPGVVPALLTSQDHKGWHRHYFAAYNIECFTDIDTYKDNIDRYLRAIRETSPTTEHDRVLYPGLSEDEIMLDRSSNGIPLHKEVINWFEYICDELSVPVLKLM